MSTKTLEKPAKNPPKKVAKETTTLGNKTVVDFVKALEGIQEDTDIAKILSISTKRRDELNYWVVCEGTNLQAIQNFTRDLKNVEEVAYCFYYLGTLNTTAKE